MLRAAIKANKSDYISSSFVLQRKGAVDTCHRDTLLYVIKDFSKRLN